MQRSTLDPAFGPALESLVRASRRPWLAIFGSPAAPRADRLGEILETHDPRRVSSLNDSIRTVTEECIGRFTRRYDLYDRARASMLVQRIVASAADAAFALMTVGSGRAREAAVRAVREVPDAFCLALIVYRLNDWVPEVRAAAEEKLASLSGALPDETIADCYELLVDFARFGRTGAVGRALVERLLDRPGVEELIRREVASSGHDRALRLLRLELRSDRLDPDLERLARLARHAGVRALALRSLLEGRFRWKDRGATASRPVAFAGSKDALARSALQDRSPRVQVAALDHVVDNLDAWSEPQEVLVPFAAHRSLPLAERALFGLRALGIDPLAVLRSRLNAPGGPSRTAAILLGRRGGPEDAAALFEAAGRLDGRARLRFLAAPARLSHAGAIAALKEVALRGPDLPLAKSAAKALADAGRRIEPDELVHLADRGQEFLDRGLRSFLFRVPALASLIILCRLERAGADLDLETSFVLLRRRINRGRFAPEPSDWDAVARELPSCPKVRRRAETMLAICSPRSSGD